MKVNGIIELDKNVYMDGLENGEVFVFVNDADHIYFAYDEGAVCIAVLNDEQWSLGNVIYSNDEYRNIPVKVLKCELTIKN